jgi:hypothetical protein
MLHVIAVVGLEEEDSGDHGCTINVKSFSLSSPSVETVNFMQ